jgi:hypothetical protein
MSRTNLKRSATPQAGRTLTRRGVVLTGVLVSTLAVGAIWMRSAEPQIVVRTSTATATVPVAGPAYSPAPTALSAPAVGVAKDAPRVAPTPGQRTVVATPVASAGQRAYLDPKTGPKAATAKVRTGAARQTTEKEEPRDR